MPQRSILNREYIKVKLEGLGEVSVKVAKDKEGNVLSVKTRI